jgi:hypothetical protein
MFPFIFIWVIPFQDQIPNLEFFLTDRLLIKPMFYSLLMGFKLGFSLVMYLFKVEQGIYTTLDNWAFSALGLLCNLERGQVNVRG